MRRALLALPLATLSACGGLDNVPLTRGVVRGTLVGADGDALVAVVGTPALSARPDALGRFTLTEVPLGAVDLLMLVNRASAERRQVTVTGGGVADVGEVAGRPVGTLEVKLRLPDNLSPRAAGVTVVGTPLVRGVDVLGEVELGLPAGCYAVRGVVPGVLPVERPACLPEGGALEVELDFPRPDGSPGQEGCSVTGCVDGYVCRPDGRCE